MINEKEFKILFDNYSKTLYNIACKHLNSSDSRDIVQELFISIWKKREKINIHTSWQAYLFASLKYTILRFLDSKNQLEQDLNVELHEIADNSEILPFEDLYQQLYFSLNQLPPQCKIIFEKKYFENKKIKEIAKELGLSLETIKTHLKRGHKIMRNQLKNSIANFLFL